MRQKKRNVPTGRAVATAAVLAVTAGCTAQATGAGAGAARTKPPLLAPAHDATPAPSPTKPKAESKPKPEATPTPEPKTLFARGAEGAQVRELQARLRQIGHFNRTPTGHYGSVTAAAVSSFQGKRGLDRTGTTDTVTWDRLLGMTKKPTRAELYPSTANPVATPDPRCMTGRVLCISKTSRTLSWMVDGKVVTAMDVRFGSQYTPTREGTFNVCWKSRHHVSTLYDTPMPYALFFSGGQAVHYSSDFAARGYSGASHGCVNVRDEGKIAGLFAQVRNGDKVVIYW
ncbi:L,D-transpeptidase family protein [Streptomyces spiramyceticus]|uniref:L,D-transpeptidase family protein n=1 Tax=Streptomyces spiramyceticus TaxID=299717 RepID=UPI00237ADB78|nr:L,D-transpeptidase family protein [Streptomyces spiramyceticus]